MVFSSWLRSSVNVFRHSFVVFPCFRLILWKNIFNRQLFIYIINKGCNDQFKTYFWWIEKLFTLMISPVELFINYSTLASVFIHFLLTFKRYSSSIGIGAFIICWSNCQQRSPWQGIATYLLYTCFVVRAVYND